MWCAFGLTGFYETILDIPQNMESSLVSRIKVMARMDIAEHRRPQDGRMSINYRGRSSLTYRVNTLPVNNETRKDCGPDFAPL